MMLESALESAQDFTPRECPCGDGEGAWALCGAHMAAALPQWKRELLQRRAARRAPPAPAPDAPPAPRAAAPDEDEELRYGPGIVKRLQSRYLSLALRDAPRRRPSLLRRAASLEHLLEPLCPAAPAAPAPPPPRAAPPAVPAEPALAPEPARRRELVKRARSVDALSRLEPCDEPAPRAPPPRPPPAPPAPPAARAGRPPRRPAPLLRDAERPPPDVVRSTLRKFEPAPGRRAASLRTPDGPRTSTPEPRARSRSPPRADLSAIDEAEGGVRSVSRAALDGIARAGCSTRYSFEAARRGSHLPPLAASNPVLLGRARRVGVIRPMPAPEPEPEPERATPEEATDKVADEPPPAPDCAPCVVDETPESPTPPSTPVGTSPSPPRVLKRSPPPAALVEPRPRSPPPEPPPPPPVTAPRSPPPAVIRTPSPQPAEHTPQMTKPQLSPRPKPLLNGHAESAPRPPSKLTRLGAAGIERAWNGAGPKKSVVVNGGQENGEVKSAVSAPWARGAAGSPPGARRGAAPVSTSVVFNFSARKEVPDYIENDGLILRASRRDCFKAGEPGVVVLRPELVAAAAAAAEAADEEPDGGPPSPCAVTFVNDNVLINGRSNMLAPRADRSRAAKLKLQFDDSLTRTFEYPSETSLCEEPAERAQLAEPAHLAPLAANTRLASAALAHYTPSKTCADAFQLGVARRAPAPPAPAPAAPAPADDAAAASEEDGGDARPCGADAARSWSEARTLATDLLF